jgi:hypothetical protein
MLAAWLRWDAVGGMCAWLLTLSVLQPGWAITLFLFAPLVLVPLALAVLTTVDRHLKYPGRWGLVLLVQPPAALLLVGAFAQPVGPWAAALAVPWLCFTGLIGLTGLFHALPWKQRSFDELCIYAGMIYLPAGGAWAVLSRWGLRPLGFSDLIVLATAVHFHYAGFILPILTGLAGRVLPRRMAWAASASVVAGVPLVAAGITLSAFAVHLPEWLAAWFMCLACFLVAALQLRIALHAGPRVSRGLLAISSGAIVAAMLLAALYALGAYCGLPWLTIEAMLPWHGAVNAFGTTLCGLLAWNLTSEKVRVAESVIPRSTSAVWPATHSSSRNAARLWP